MRTPTGTMPGPISLRRLFAQATFTQGQDLVVSSATDDSRRVRPGQLYVALRGTRFDGHCFLREAAQRGAAGALVSRPLDHLDCPQCVVPDTRAAWSRLCHALMGNPAEGLSLVGVTGTNGKTTTALLVRQIFNQTFGRCGLLGTLEYHDGVFGTSAHLTTPEPQVLAYWLHRMQQHGTRYAAMEVSSHALCQYRLDGLELDAAVITNITGDHLDYHGTYEAYKQSKRRIFDYLAAGGVAVVNLDDPCTAELCTSGRRTAPGNLLSFGVEVDADVSAKLLESSAAGQRFRLCIGSEEADVMVRLIGLHNVSNCLAAAAVAHRYGIDFPQIVAGLESLPAVPGRLEPVDCGTRYGVFVDYAHTDDALHRVLLALRPLVAGRLICVFGAGGDRDQQKRPRMARAVEAGADLAVVTSDNPRHEDPDVIIADILKGFLAPEMAHVEPDRRKAIRWALESAAPGDAVLIAGKGHEPYQLVGDARLEFDDRRVAREEACKLGHNQGRSPLGLRRSRQVAETV